MIKRLEALADAIAELNEYHNPDSQAYKLRNPGLLHAKTLASLANSTDDCLRIFESHQSGYKALLNRIEKRCKYEGERTVTTLLATFGFSDEKVNHAVSFINRSLLAEHEVAIGVRPSTRISFFMEQ
jgi:hypothetical protein